MCIDKLICLVREKCGWKNSFRLLNGIQSFNWRIRMVEEENECLGFGFIYAVESKLQSFDRGNREMCMENVIL